MTERETITGASRHRGPDEAPRAQEPPVADEPVTDADHGPAAGGESTAVASAEPLGISVNSGPPLAGSGSVGGGRIRLGDRVFSLLASGSAVFVIVLVLLVAAFLLAKSVPSIAADKVNFLTSTQWITDPNDLRFGVANLLWWTVIISMIGMVIAVPIAIGIALFITQYAPKRIARPVAYVIDLLAAIPSIVYGIWGYTTLSSALEPVQRALYHLGGLPLFKNQGQDTGTLFDGGVVLAVMVLPIITAISRDVFDRTPRANVEAALALGATRWEMIRLAVLPYGRPGIISGAMLGLGRALGETIAVTLILSKISGFNFSIFSGGETFASKIANNAAEFDTPKSTGAYIAAGLVLFVLTFIVNAAARAVVNRRKEFS